MPVQQYCLQNCINFLMGRFIMVTLTTIVCGNTFNCHGIEPNNMLTVWFHSIKRQKKFFFWQWTTLNGFKNTPQFSLKFSFLFYNRISVIVLITWCRPTSPFHICKLSFCSVPMSRSNFRKMSFISKYLLYIRYTTNKSGKHAWFVACYFVDFAVSNNQVVLVVYMLSFRSWRYFANPDRNKNSFNWIYATPLP